jgi:ribokinase
LTLPVIVLGSLNMDVVVHVQALPLPGETVAAEGPDYYPGGKGANQAVAAARMGAAVAMLGAVGDDAFGAQLLDVLDTEGIDRAAVMRLEGRPTGTAYIAIDAAGENQILVAGGANRVVYAGIEELAPAGPAVRLAQLETPLAALDAFFAGGDAGTMRILNAAPHVADARRLFRRCDIVIVNETELAAYTGSPVDPDSAEAIIAAARALLEADAQWIVVTRGKRGALAISRTQVIEVPARSARVVDTTGAGDCFCGVLAAALGAGRAMAEALGEASVAAALSVEQAGAIPSMPRRGDLARCY